MPVHHPLERIIGRVHCDRRPSERPTAVPDVNSVGTAVTGRSLNRYNAWAAIGKRAKAAVFSRLLDVIPDGPPKSQFTWRTMDGPSMPSRWPGMSLREPSSTDRTKYEITLSEEERIRCSYQRNICPLGERQVQIVEKSMRKASSARLGLFPRK
jgi:hypothetical protein